VQSDAYLPRDRQPLLIHIPGPKAKLQTFSDLGKNFTLRHISLAKCSRFSFEKKEHKPFCHLLTLHVNNSFLFTNGNTYTNRGTWSQLHSALRSFTRNLYRKRLKLKSLAVHEGIWWSEGATPFIFNLGTRWMSMLSPGKCAQTPTGQWSGCFG